MADSYFSCFLKHPTTHSRCNHKQQLLQERDNALQYAQKLEDRLKRNTEQFNLRYESFRQQLNESSQIIKELRQQNKAKDQLLNGNSKVIMEKTTEIIKLKDEIKELNDILFQTEGEKLAIASLQIGTETNLQRTNSCPSSSFYLYKSSSIRCHHINGTKLCHEKSQSDYTGNCCNKIKKAIPTKPLPSDPISKYEFPPEMPFIHRKTSTQTSSLSEVAVNLSFPGSTSPLQMSSPTPIHTNVKPLQLSPICEMKSRDDETKKKRINLLKISDNNSNIVNEWGQSIAGSDDRFDIHEKLGNAATMRIRSIPNEFTSIAPHASHGDIQNDHEGLVSDNEDNISENSSETSFGEYLNVRNRKQSDNISYCSDNTVMLNDINMSLTESMKRNSLHNIDVLRGNHFSKKSTGNLSINDCDIIESPVKIFSLNHSFKIVLNNQ